VLYPFFKTIDDKRKYGFMDNRGTVVISPVYDFADFFSEGLALIEIDELYGFVDRDGKIIIEPMFKFADSFSEGLAFVNYQDECCWIDLSGEVVIHTGLPFLENSYGYPYKNGVTVLMVDDGEVRTNFYAINSSGEILFEEEDEIDYTSITEGIYPYTDLETGLRGYKDIFGNILIEPRFEGAGPFSEGMAYVRVGEYYGYINRQGNMVIPPNYINPKSFSEGVVSVAQYTYDGGIVYFYLDKIGKRLSSATYGFTGSFNRGRAVVENYDEDGAYLIGKDGRIVYTFPEWAEDPFMARFDENGYTMIVDKYKGESALLSINGEVMFPLRVGALNKEKATGILDSKYQEIESYIFDTHQQIDDILGSSNLSDDILEGAETEIRVLFDDIFDFFKEEYNKRNVLENDWWLGYFSYVSVIYLYRSIIASRLKDFYKAMEFSQKAADYQLDRESIAFFESCDNIWRNARYSTNDGVLWTNFSLVDSNLGKNITFDDVCSQLLSEIKKRENVAADANAFRVVKEIHDNFYGKDYGYSDYETLDEAIEGYKQSIMGYLEMESEIDGLKMPFYWIVKEEMKGEFPFCKLKSDQGDVINFTIKEIPYKDAIIIKN
jgi:hypothetical protein